MTALPPKTATHLQTINTHFSTLTEWAEATARLHENYNRLLAYVSQNEPKKKTSSESGRLYIGQYPVDQLLTLLIMMQKQMETLVVDMERTSPSDLPVQTENYKKLAAHTRVINKLNQEAQTKLLLTTLLPA